MHFTGGFSQTRYKELYPYELFYRYQVFRALDKDEARALIVDCTQQILDHINQCKLLKSHIPESGYDASQVNLYIQILPNKNFQLHPELSGVAIFKGEIEYRTLKSSNPVILKSKTYEIWTEAVALNEKNSVNKN